jgi:DNA-binding transcriptional MerR regulator
LVLTYSLFIYLDLFREEFIISIMSGITLSCIVTKEEKYINSTILKNKLKKFGDEDTLRRFYVSRPAAKLLKTGLSIQQVRERLNSKATTTVDYEVLYKLKILKSSKGKRKKHLSSEEAKLQREESDKKAREWYEMQEKMKTCKKTWVEEMTGGANGCQVPYGGTCIRPDIYYNHEYNTSGRCSPCPHNEYCLCANKVLKK